jgi:hypothetical protein
VIFDLQHRAENTMFMLIEKANERKSAQAQLKVQLGKSFQEVAIRNIGFPGGNVPSARVHTDGKLWFHILRSSSQDEGTTPRTFNWFGQMGEAGQSNVNITVEINIPLQSGAQVAGCFVVDPSTDVRYLAHSGKIGGGQKGVGKREFLAWGEFKRVEVVNSVGKRRKVILVMPLDGAGVVAPLRSFVDQVAKFKQAARDGALDVPALRQKGQLKDYYDESGGERKGKRSSIIDYVSRHGDVVKALEQWTSAHAHTGAKSKKNVKVDLAMEHRGVMIDLFEVKTARERSHIYTAIGQLVTHEGATKCRKHMVLPRGAELDDDLAGALKRCQITLINYEIDKVGTVKILGWDHSHPPQGWT